MENYKILQKDYEEAYQFIGVVSKDWQSPPNSREINMLSQEKSIENLSVQKIVEKASVFRSFSSYN